MLEEVGTYVRIADLLLAMLLILDRGVKSTLVIAIVIFTNSVIAQIVLSYRRLKITNNYNQIIISLSRLLFLISKIILPSEALRYFEFETLKQPFNA